MSVPIQMLSIMDRLYGETIMFSQLNWSRRSRLPVNRSTAVTEPRAWMARASVNIRIGEFLRSLRAPPPKSFFLVCLGTLLMTSLSSLP